MSINSKVISQLSKESWNIKSINFEKKIKEKNLIHKIKDFNLHFDICFLNVDYPIWKIFDTINFDILIFESNKNIEQMDFILNKYYLKINHIYFYKEYLKNKYS